MTTRKLMTTSEATMAAAQAGTILICDDDPHATELMADILRHHGFTTLTALDGETALAQIVPEHDIALALVDYQMSPMDGLSLGAALAEQDIPFIMVTATFDLEVVNNAAAIGTQGYLVKPIGASNLIAQITLVLTRIASHADKRRDIHIATGLYACHHGLDTRQAFQQLRAHARRQRVNMAQLARDYIAQANAGTQALAMLLPPPDRTDP